MGGGGRREVTVAQSRGSETTRSKKGRGIAQGGGSGSERSVEGIHETRIVVEMGARLQRE